MGPVRRARRWLRRRAAKRRRLERLAGDGPWCLLCFTFPEDDIVFEEDQVVAKRHRASIAAVRVCLSCLKAVCDHFIARPFDPLSAEVRERTLLVFCAMFCAAVGTITTATVYGGPGAGVAAAALAAVVVWRWHRSVLRVATIDVFRRMVDERIAERDRVEGVRRHLGGA